VPQINIHNTISYSQMFLTGGGGNYPLGGNCGISKRKFHSGGKYKDNDKSDKYGTNQ